MRKFAGAIVGLLGILVLAYPVLPPAARVLPGTVVRKLAKWREPAPARPPGQRVSQARAGQPGAPPHPQNSEAKQTQSELEKTLADLKARLASQSITGTLVATDAKELAALKQMGDRSYVDITLDKSDKPRRFGDISLLLKQTDPDKNRYSVQVLADGKLTEKSDNSINEPVQFYAAHAGNRPYELVINSVAKDHVTGYLATAASPKAPGQASPPPPAARRGSPNRTATRSKQPADLRPETYPGRILFQPERTMQLQRAEVVMVRMDAGASSDLLSGIDPKLYKIDSVKVAQRMRVHLDADPPDAFHIALMSPPGEEQAVTNISAATWMWSVTPIKPVKNSAAELLLHIWALAKVEGSDTLVPLFQKTEIIQVRGIPLPEVTAGGFSEKVIDGVAEHSGEAISGLIGVALMALGGRIAKWWRKPKAAAAPAP